MAEREIIKIKNLLLKLFREKGISLQKIVVFGSYARSQEKKDSDIDIIIVSKNFRNQDIFEIVHLTKDVHWRLVEEIMKPFDIMFYSDVDWRKGKSLVVNAAKKEGKVIYAERRI
jgi:predicted nucleotidyltransferase